MNAYGSIRQYQERAAGHDVSAGVVCLACVGMEKECPVCLKLGLEWFSVAHPGRPGHHTLDKVELVMREVNRR